MGGSHPHRQRPRLVVLATVPVHRGHPDLLSGLAVLYGRRAISQDFHRVSAGRRRLHALSDRQRCLLRNPLPGTLLVRYPRSDRHAVNRRAFALLDSRREKHVALLLVAARKPGRISLQSTSLVIRRCHLPGDLLSILSHLGRSTY